MSYTCITDDEKIRMLREIGYDKIEKLFNDIPESIALKKSLNLPLPLSEIEIENHIKKIESKNKVIPSFLGAGAYNHYIPAVVDQLSSRSEFYTAYTPYQAEVSQGTLTAIFEFQTFICRLTGMDVANASMYDGATSLAEAVMMSVRSNKKNKIIISNAVHPTYRDVLKTYAWASSIEIAEISSKDGLIQVSDIEKYIDDTVSAVVIQNPNFFGLIENIKSISDIVHKHKSNVIVVITEPLSLALLKSPGELGADIVCGEAQGFGNRIGFGGPLLGFLSARKEFTRSMPGRLVGKSTDLDGNEAYILTLQTREQHIRRERATSNICTNQGLCTLKAVIYLSFYGNKLKDLAEFNHNIASYLREKMISSGFLPLHEKPFFNEFVVKIDNAEKIHKKLLNKGYTAGLYLGNYYTDYKDCLLLCATEMNTVEEIEWFIKALRG